MTDENKPNLHHGAPLIMEDLEVTLKVHTIRFAYRYGFFGRLLRNLYCRHTFTDKIVFGPDFCTKCSLIKRTK
jgi:hypothetical protein